MEYKIKLFFKNFDKELESRAQVKEDEKDILKAPNLLADVKKIEDKFSIDLIGIMKSKVELDKIKEKC